MSTLSKEQEARLRRGLLQTGGHMPITVVLASTDDIEAFTAALKGRKHSKLIDFTLKQEKQTND